jgi:hypothetical protein
MVQNVNDKPAYGTMGHDECVALCLQACASAFSGEER